MGEHVGSTMGIYIINKKQFTLKLVILDFILNSTCYNPTASYKNEHVC